MNTESINDLLNNLKRQYEVDSKYGKEIIRDFGRYELTYKDLGLIFDYINFLETDNVHLWEEIKGFNNYIHALKSKYKSLKKSYDDLKGGII